MSTSGLANLPVGVVIERHKATSPWIDYVWRASSVLEGVPTAAPWTVLGTTGDTTSFYAGAAIVALHRTETANYLSNLEASAPLLWVVLRPTGMEPPLEIVTVTADPAEGEAFSEAGQDLVETVPMPRFVVAAVEAFVVEHHVERPFFKRRRDTVGEGQRSPKESRHE